MSCKPCEEQRRKQQEAEQAAVSAVNSPSPIEK